MTKENRLKLEEEMRCHIQTWQQSKQTQHEYCHQNNLTYHKFIYWLSKFHRKDKSKETAFIHVQMEQPVHGSNPELEIAYPNGVRLRVPSGDIQFIGQLIRII